MNRPSYIPRTGEIEFNNAPGLIERHKGKAFVATEKLDGFSFSFFCRHGAFGMTNRDRQIENTENSVFTEAVKAFSLSKIAKQFDGLFFQGEIIGEGIRSNKLAVTGIQFHVFNIGTIGGEFMSHDKAREICLRSGLDMVPEIKKFTLESESQLIELASGKSAINSLREKEGSVFRPIEEGSDAILRRLSFKVFNPRYEHKDRHCWN